MAGYKVGLLGGAPSGAAGGDLGGTYPNPTVDDGADGSGIHDDTASEISAIALKATIVGADHVLIEDSAAANAKARTTAQDIADLAMAGTRGSINGARVTWTAVTTVTVGVALLNTTLRDSTNVHNIVFTGVETAIITSSGAGGLDTGAEAADTWYAIHIIDDTTAVNTPAAMLSLSATAPTLPGGYDVFRRVGWVRNNASSNFLKFNQRGADRDRRYGYDEAETVTSVLTGGTATSWAAVSLASFVPTTSELAILMASTDQGDPAPELRLRRTGDTVSEANALIKMGDSGDDFGAGSPAHFPEIEIVTNASQSIDYAVSAAGVASDIFVRGFIDEI